MIVQIGFSTMWVRYDKMKLFLIWHEFIESNQDVHAKLTFLGDIWIPLQIKIDEQSFNYDEWIPANTWTGR